MNQDPLDPIWIERDYKPNDKEVDFVGSVYQDFYRWRTFRSGSFQQLQGDSIEKVWTISRQLFWNATYNRSEDLSNIGLDFNIPFTRKEVLEFTGRLVSLGIKPTIIGDDLDAYGVKILNALYQKWRFKNNDRVEKFWELIYGVINGTVCLYVGYNDKKKKESFLKSFDPTTMNYSLDEKEVKYWDDVEVTLVPIEDMYLSKIYERNIQKQGKVIWKTQLDPADFHREYQNYPDHIFVQPGLRIAEDSLYFRLLAGTGVTTLNKIEVLRVYDTDNDQHGVVANGILLNKLGKDERFKIAPMPFDHKEQPFVWSISEAIDEKLAYGMPQPYKTRDLHKMSNAQYVMLLEHALRIVDKPFLSSDIESPAIIFGGGKKVIPVTDVNAYKEIEVQPLGNEYMTSVNSVQQMMSTLAQGGVNQAIPSIQPKSAAEVDQVNQAKQQAMGIPVLMYYNMCRQEIMLILKTMLQFYGNKKYAGETDNILKAMTVPNMPLTLGGMGDLEIRFVKKVGNPLDLHWEAVRKSMQNGRMTEIIEAPIDLIQNLEFQITEIDLEPEQTSEMKKTLFTSSFLVPLLQNWGQTGLLDPAKTLTRFLEKNGESPQDYISDKVLPQVMSTWSGQHNLFPNQIYNINRNSPAGANAQSPVGQAFGGQSNGGQPQGQPQGQGNSFQQMQQQPQQQ